MVDIKGKFRVETFHGTSLPNLLLIGISLKKWRNQVLNPPQLAYNRFLKLFSESGI